MVFIYHEFKYSNMNVLASACDTIYCCLLYLVIMIIIIISS